jgi:mRNA-binding protein PUF3
LAASSEAITWGPPWSVDKTSPTVSTSGSASPERHRSSVPLALTQTSPYLTTSRTSICHGPVLNNTKSPGKSTLDPASGTFKYSFQKAPFGYTDEKENMSQMNSIGHSIDNYGIERTWRSNSSASRDNSGPPSRQSESSSSGAANSSFFGNGQYPAIGHTPSNSLQMQRPPAQGRVQSFSSLNGRGYTDLTNGVADLDLNLNRLKDSQNSYMEPSVEHPYPSPSGYQHYISAQAQPGSASMWATGLGSTSRSLSSYFPDTSTDSAFAEQLNTSKASRFSDRGSTSPGNGYRRQPTSPAYYHANEAASAELEHAPLRNLRPQSVPEIDRGLQRHQFALQQQYLPPQVVYNGQFQGQYPPHIFDYSHHNFPINPQQGYQMPAPPYTPTLPVPRGPARDQDYGGFVLRSQLLEEFRVSSKTNRRYELKVRGEISCA